MYHERIKSAPKRYCSYKGCSSDSVTTNDGAISFFGFPKDTERCSKWITNCGREEFRYLTPQELSSKKICELHFHPCMFSNELRTYLKRQAFPMNWKNAIPELIEIDDDDDDDEAENEHVFGDDIETVIVNGTGTVQELSDDEDDNGQNTLNAVNTILESAPDNGPAIGDSGNEDIRNTDQDLLPVEGTSNANIAETSVERQCTSTVTSSTSVEEDSRAASDKTPLKSNPPPTDKTKFHNLPSQTTQGEFYYQQCQSAEDTSHSYPEPPEGEMPLFVQQSSVLSMAEETANSEVSEPPTRKRKRDSEADLQAQMGDAMKYLKDITELLTTSEDEFELFGKSVALQLKKMSLCTALAVQAKIQQVLSQCRIKDIRKKARGQDNNVKVNGVEVDRSEEEQEEDNVEKSTSPQLSLDCMSKSSGKEVDDEEK